MYTLPTQPQTIGRVLDAGFTLYAHTFRSVLPLAALSAALTMLAAIPMIFVGNEPGSHNPRVIWAIAAMFAAMVIDLGIMGAIIHMMDQGAANRSVTAREALRQGYGRFWTLLFAWLLYGAYVALGFVALVVPGIILMLSMTLYPMTVMVDGDGPWSALKHSHRLVWGNWWRVAAVVTVPAAILLVVYLAIVGVITMLSRLGDGMSPVVANLIVELCNNGVGVLLMPMLYAVVMALYHDLRIRKEGGDIASRILRA